MFKNRINCILLVDDDESTNFINTHLLTRANLANHIKVSLNGEEALAYLNQSIASSSSERPFPDIIFLDINMPVMDGWEFLDEYDKFSQKIKDKIMIICMLTTSLNEIDEQKAETSKYISGFLPKPLTVEVIQDIATKHFQQLGI